MSSKKCPRCKEEKTLDEFYRRKDGISKNQSYCTPCMKQYNKEKWKKQKEKKKGWWF
tara:strand:+ start:152 stop:322 length:171 start_codon:yes stop_codon:yes gene_type:complete